ncbi:MAG: hydantoinase B/oxoprolinase family protein [Nitrospinota bacterium]
MNRAVIDPITADVIAHRLRASSEEMMAALVKTAYSPNIKERRDCSTGIFDAAGRLLALTAIAPIHLSSVLGMVENVIARFPFEDIKPGDGFLTNDPYTGGGSHLPDLTLAAPVFVDGKVVAFVANIAHHSDVGGKVAGSESADCTSIFQEGIRIPPVRIFIQGELQSDIMDIVLANSRTPRERKGDLNAQFATNAIGVRRVEEIFGRFGTDTTLNGIEAMLDASEVRTRAGIAALPDGDYEYEDFMDNDGFEDRLIRLKVMIRVRGDRLSFDFTGTDPQIQGSRNMVLVSTLATVYYAVKAIVDPDLPPNAGYFRAVSVHAPPGTVLNAELPAAVGDRSSTGNVLGDVLLGAFAKAVPDRVMAACGPLHGLIFSGIHPRRKEYFVDYETYAGASGGLADQDGKDAVRVHISGAANLPVESVEHEYPLTVKRYELIPDSGGLGRFRGGLGTRRDIVIWAEDARVAGRGLRQTRGAPGLFGGGSGATGRFVLHPGGPEEQKLPATFSEIPIPAGTTLRVETPAGAGYGDPLERDPERVAADVLAGKVTPAAAEGGYGVVLREGRVDERETASLRARMSREQESHGV